MRLADRQRSRGLVVANNVATVLAFIVVVTSGAIGAVTFSQPSLFGS